LTRSAAQFARVEGKLILREKFRGTGSGNSRTALRISIHDQKKAGFVVVIEVTLAGFPNPANKSWTGPLITDRHAAWFLDGGAKGITKHTLESLMIWSRNLGHNRLFEEFPGLPQLPFLLTEALLNHGFDIKDVEHLKIPI